MTLDRDGLVGDFDLASPPVLYCPDCGTGHLAFDDSTRRLMFDKKSRDAEEVLSPDEFVAHGCFSCVFRCNRCGSEGTAIGEVTHSYEQRYVGDEIESISNFAVCAIAPAPLLFRPPDRTPLKVSEALLSAFGLFWIDAPACAARCRTAVERLMDYLKIPRTHTVNRKRRRLTTHDRIREYAKKNPEIADLLFATKWIGNDGAHEVTLNRDDALDAFDILEAALDRLFGTTISEATSVARQVNRKRGPRSRHKGRIPR